MKQFEITESYVAKKTSYARFAKLQNEIISCSESVIVLTLNIKNRFGYTFVFLFSNLIFLARQYNKTLAIYCNNKSFLLLQKIGLISKNTRYESDKDYARHILENSNTINIDYDIFRTVTEITSEAPIKMSPELSALFISKAGEMYNNAKEHSEGIVIGIKYFKNQKSTYCFSCYDTGVGIPRKVMKSRPEIMSPIEAFQWAMIDGNSTVTNGVPRGLGLGLLKSFAKANEGAIRICSGNVLYTYNTKTGEHYYELNDEFHGTLFEMDIIADNNHKYILR